MSCLGIEPINRSRSCLFYAPTGIIVVTPEKMTLPKFPILVQTKDKKSTIKLNVWEENPTFSVDEKKVNMSSDKSDKVSSVKFYSAKPFSDITTTTSIGISVGSNAYLNGSILRGAISVTSRCCGTTNLGARCKRTRRCDGKEEEVFCHNHRPGADLKELNFFEYFRDSYLVWENPM